MEGLKDDNLGNKMLQVQLPVVYAVTILQLECNQVLV